MFAVRAERETNRMMQSKTEEIIKIEDDSDEPEDENGIPVQCLSLVQSTTGDWDEYFASDSSNSAEKSINESIGSVCEQYVKQSGLESSKPTTTTILVTTTTIVPAIQPQTSFNDLKFQCNYCSISRNEIECIYKHWIYSGQHAEAYNAFQFHIEMNGACFNCNESGTFKELKQHFKNKHPGLHFGAVNMSDKTKCLICGFKVGNMGEHFRIHHAMTMEMDSLSPIRLPANILDALKATRVQKKFKCGCCDDAVYNTKNQIIEHYRCNSLNHDIKRSPFIEFVDERPTLAICGICQKTCDETNMLDHMQNHQIQCLNCAAFDGKINELAWHYQEKHPGISMNMEKLKFGIAYLQTKLVHCNGLTLAYANVLGAKDDENEKVQSFLTMTLSQCTQSILRSPPDEPNSPVPALLNSNGSVVSFDDIALISPRSTGSKTDPNDFLRKELFRQRSYLDTLVILGLPAAYMSNDKHLLTMFVSLCLLLKVSIKKDEIKSIYSSQNELNVKLSTRAKKEKIIQSMASKYHWPRELKSDALVKISKNEIPQTVYVNPKLTSHFHRMWMKAKRFRMQNKIYNYRLSTGGIAIQKTKGDEEVFARSFEDIDNCVNRTSQPIKRTTNIDPTTKPNPKRMKSH